MPGANPHTSNPAAKRMSPTRYGGPAPRRSACDPAKTIPIIVPRKKAAVTQPYQAMPPRSRSTSGRIVVTASDSNATKVTTETNPTSNARRPGTLAALASTTLTSRTVRPQANLKSTATSRGSMTSRRGSGAQDATQDLARRPTWGWRRRR